jgi:hypothetical protein
MSWSYRTYDLGYNEFISTYATTNIQPINMSDGGVTYTDENGVEQQGLFYGSNPVIKYDFKKILESTKIPNPDTTLAVDVVASDATITTAQQAAMNSLSSILEENLPEEIRPGVTEVFESNPELASIGTQEEYSQYLNTIFPDSKVKDIVYRGENEKQYKGEKEYHYSPIKDATIGYGNSHAALLNTINPFEAKIQRDTQNKIPNEFDSVLNYNPKTIDLSMVKMSDRFDFFEKKYPRKEEETDREYNNRRRAFAVNGVFNEEYLKGNEHGIVHSTIGNVLPEIKVSKPEQIHILGSKQDIEGFKEFVSKGQPVAKTVSNSVGTQSKAAESLDSLQNLLNFTPQSERNGKTAQEVLDYLKVAQISHLPEGYNPFKRCS